MTVGILESRRPGCPPAFGIPVRGAAAAPVDACCTRCAAAAVRLIHVADDDRHVLEPAVVAARVERDGRPARRQILASARSPRRPSRSRTTRRRAPNTPSELLVLRVPTPRLGHLLEVEHLGVELDRAVHVRHREPTIATRLTAPTARSGGSAPTATAEGRHARAARVRAPGEAAASEQRGDALRAESPCPEAHAGSWAPVPGCRGLTRAQPLQHVVAHAQRVGHDRERRIHGAAGGEEAAVHDVQVVHLVRLAVARRAPTCSGRGRSGWCRSGAPRRPAGCAGRRTGSGRRGPGGTRARGSRSCVCCCISCSSLAMSRRWPSSLLGV